MSSRRQRRMQETLKRELSRIIREEFSSHDLDMNLVSVTHVDVTPDFREATVYVSHIKDDPELTTECLKLLRRNEKTLRGAITRALPLKVIPNFRFREDTSIKEAAQITDIIQDLQEEREDRNRGPQS